MYIGARKITICALALIMALTFFGGTRGDAYAETGKIDTGNPTIYGEKPTADQLRQRYAQLPQEPAYEDIFSVKNDLEAYTPAELTDDAYNYTKQWLNMYRYQAGVGDIDWLAGDNSYAAEGALLLARLGDGLTHSPATPEGLEEDQISKGKYACQNSNLDLGPVQDGVLGSALKRMMDDSDDSNMPDVGHRRLLIYPGSTYMGLGAAEAGDEFYTLIKPKSQKSSYNVRPGYNDFQVIAWPASGYMLNTLMNTYTPWSATLKKATYGTMEQDDITVTVTRQSDGQSWTMDSSDSNAVAGGKYFNVSTVISGFSNTVIFTPGRANLGKKPLVGTYTVEIKGFPNEAETGPVVYDVNFIDPTKAGMEELDIEVSNASFTGAPITENVVSVKTQDGTVLTEDTDYTLQFENNTNIGTATVKITGKGLYAGEVTKTFEITETQHVWNDGEVTEEPTCSKKGTMTYTCLGCQQTRTEEIDEDENAHTWQDGDIITEATCTAEGEKKCVCSGCSAETTKPIPVNPNNHTWNEGTVTKEPTCSTEGVRLMTCTGCGAEKTSPVPTVPDAHIWNEGIVTDTGSCTTEGTKRFTCTECGAEKTEHIPGDASKHNWDEGAVKTPATCTQDGEKLYTCFDCGATRTETIKAQGHKWDEGTETTPATCTLKGVMTYSCTQCDATTTAEIAATGHKWGEWVDKEASTCTQAGYQERQCTKCNATETKGLALADHTWSSEYTVDKEPTCDEEGTESRHCEQCGAVLESSVRPIQALGHDWGDWKVTRNATCKQNGIKERTCKRDPAHTETVDFAGTHSWRHVTVAAGLLRNGSSYDQCTVCGTKTNVVTLAGYATYYVKSFKVSKGSKAFTAKWKKQSKANQKKFAGYQIRYSTASNMSGAKYASAGKSSKSKKIKGLKKKTTYYVQVRTYTKSGGTTFYSGWSGVKSVKTK